MKSNRTPPRLATWLLRRFLRTDLQDEVTADLLEQYDDTSETSTVFRARLDYWYQVIQYFRPFAIRRFQYQSSNQAPMYKNYLKTSVRSMIKNKLHASINIVGLTVGMAVSILIALWIWDEISYDKSFENYDRVGHIKQNLENNGEVQTWFNLPYPLADELRKNYGTDFEHIAMTTTGFPQYVATETHKFYKTGIFAEGDFTKIFKLNMIEGEANVLDEASNVLISRSMAQAYFGNAKAIGQILTIEKRMTVKVAGVYEDFPTNSSFSDVQFIGAWDMIYRANDYKSMEDPWRPNMMFIYVKLTQQSNFQVASERIRDAKLKNVNAFLAKKKPALFIHPMSRWHLHGEFKNGKEAGGRNQYVWLFGVVGVFVLLMACINFMNLSTARSEQRAKEVGVRKAIGSLRSQLVKQFFLESILTTLVSFAFALLLVQLSLSYFNQIAEKDIHLDWINLKLWLAGFSFCFVIGLIAGSYPALYLSSIKAISAIKGSFRAGGAAAIPRKVMVTVQFTVSVTLIIGTITVYLQIQHAKDRPMGYESDGLVVMPMSSGAVHEHFEAIKHNLENDGAIVGLSEAGSSTTQIYSSSSGFDWPGKDPDLSVDFTNIGVSHDYGKTIGWEIVQGRDFSRDFPSDSSAFIINEAAARFMGLKNPVGEVVRWHDHPMTVVGVVRNIIIRSPYDEVPPNFYFLSQGAENVLLARINPKAGIVTAMEKIEKAVKTYDPEAVFSFEFVDEAYNRKFGNEERIGRLATIFASLAIFISCLGIFGLSSFIAEQKTKEIGIRKVLGASIFQVWTVMCKDFLVLVIFSCVIAIPVAYTILSSWLGGYTYHIGIPLWAFVASTGGTIGIMLMTISWHTWQAARLNPSNSLRTE